MGAEARLPRLSTYKRSGRNVLKDKRMETISRSCIVSMFRSQHTTRLLVTRFRIAFMSYACCLCQVVALLCKLPFKGITRERILLALAHKGYKKKGEFEHELRVVYELIQGNKLHKARLKVTGTCLTGDCIRVGCFEASIYRTPPMIHVRFPFFRDVGLETSMS